MSIAIYVHWPFCLSLCPYCDFNSHVASNIDHEEWARNYITELEYFLPHIKDKKITSVFFGGGTPSLMAPKTVSEILDFLAKIAKIDKSIEVTLEANPTSVEAEKFAQFRQAGINRLSLGIQSLNDEDLKILGRKHNADEALNAIEIAGKYFANYSFDLIYARPHQTIKSWQKELEAALKMSANHISLYQLTIEKGTPFYKLSKEGKLPLPDQELSADLYQLTNEMLIEKGFGRYEISNYAKKGFESLHNLTYWRYQEYLGIGPGAHSRIDNKAIMMHHMPGKWQKSIKDLGHGIQTQNLLSLDDKITEMVMMNLRIKEGLSLQNFLKMTEKNFFDISDGNYFAILQKEKFIKVENDFIKLTDKGLNLHNYIIPRLLSLRG